MQVEGDYKALGYAHIRNLIPTEVAAAFLRGLQDELARAQIPINRFLASNNLLTKSSIEIYGHFYKPMIHFLWALTPVMRDLVGRELLPTYDYFRIYRQGDICRVHSDRQACEHSLSLTLGYSDGLPWNLDVSSERIPAPSPAVDEHFDAAPHHSIAMGVGDAVLYEGVHHRHGRVTPNPNRWSAHLFLHWVDRDGPYREFAFDGRDPTERPVDFLFG